MGQAIGARLMAFVQDKGCRLACERCEQSNWLVPPDHEIQVDLPLTQVGGNVRIPAPAIPAYIMVCRNRGNIRLHAASVVSA